MTYLQKEEAILAALERTGYAGFECGKAEALDFLEDCLSSFAECFAATANRSRDAGPCLNRAAIMSGKLDDLCAGLGLEPFLGADRNDKAAVLEAIGRFAMEAFDAAIANHTPESLPDKA